MVDADLGRKAAEDSMMEEGEDTGRDEVLEVKAEEGHAAAGAGQTGCDAVRGAGHLPRPFRATDPAPRLPSRDVVGACGMAAVGFVELAVRLPLRETDPAPRPPGHDTSSMGGVAAAGCLGPAGGLLQGGALDGRVGGNSHRGHITVGAG